MSSKRIVIVGGMAGGANAAARARRIDERAEILIYERSDNVSLANCGLPYYLGGEKLPSEGHFWFRPRKVSRNAITSK